EHGVVALHEGRVTLDAAARRREDRIGQVLGIERTIVRRAARGERTQQRWPGESRHGADTTSGGEVMRAAQVQRSYFVDRARARCRLEPAPLARTTRAAAAERRTR